MSTPSEYLYEFSYLASPNLDDAGITKLKNEIDALVVKFGGSIREHQETTKRSLAYPINKQKTAYFISEQVILSGDGKSAFMKELKLNEKIFRHMFIRLTEKFLRRLQEKRVTELHTIAPDRAKEKISPKPAVAEVSKPSEEQKTDIAEIEKKLDEILEREL